MRDTCDNCKSKENCENVAYFISKDIDLSATYCTAWEPVKKMTNGDRIRAMTDEELVGRINGSNPCVCCVYRGQDCVAHDYSCDDGILIWMQQEAADD